MLITVSGWSANQSNSSNQDDLSDQADTGNLNQCVQNNLNFLKD